MSIVYTQPAANGMVTNIDSKNVVGVDLRVNELEEVKMRWSLSE